MCMHRTKRPLRHAGGVPLRLTESQVSTTEKSNRHGASNLYMSTRMIILVITILSLKVAIAPTTTTTKDTRRHGSRDGR